MSEPKAGMRQQRFTVKSGDLSWKGEAETHRKALIAALDTVPEGKMIGRLAKVTQGMTVVKYFSTEALLSELGLMGSERDR